MNYIAFIDMVGTKNLANFDAAGYMEYITNFQQLIILHLDKLENKGKIHFFSDCAYIESEDPEILITFLSSFRIDLMTLKIFLKGSIVEGKLGAITGPESESDVKKMYGDEVLRKFKTVRPQLLEHKNQISGTLFYCNDIAKAFKMQDNLKGIGCFVHSDIIKISKSIEHKTVDSFYVKDTHKNILEFFKDLKYSNEFISNVNAINLIIQVYARSNTYSQKYGRYYLTILASIINSSNFKKLSLNKNDSSKSGKFLYEPPIFTTIMNLKKKFPLLYEKAYGLEYLYFALLNKIYNDQSGGNETTKEILKIILNSKRFINKYMNNLEALPTKLISDQNKGKLISDYFDIYGK
ncbi:MAG: hypothetical protein J0L56_14895 [Chitinophagales bacterium]|nr:hypothetical protein [Chitinophagales bacterium]